MAAFISVSGLFNLFFMIKKRAYLKLSNATNNTVLLKATSIVGMLTSHPEFTAPTPSLTDIRNDIDALEQTIEAAAVALLTYKEKLVTIKEKKNHLVNQLQNLAGYVDTVADGDEAKIIGAGFEIKRKNIRKIMDYRNNK